MADIVIRNTTISGNAGSQAGAVNANGSTVRLQHVTMNNTGLVADNIYNTASTIKVDNSVIVGDGNPGPPNCDESGLGTPIVTFSGSFADGGACDSLAETPGLSAGVLPLQTYTPGTTPTHALSAGTALIDAGAAGSCTATDQRGVARPQGAGCDPGAFERIPFVLGPVTPPLGGVGEPYSYLVSGSGEGALSFAISGGALPAGLSLAASGVLSGTPLVSGTFAATVQMSDAFNTVTQAATLRILPPNAPPVITGLSDAAIQENTVAVGSFTVSDDRTAVEALTFAVAVSNPSLLPPGRVLVGGAGASRTLRVAPAPDRTGVSAITVSVSDGSYVAHRTIQLTVSSAPAPIAPFHLEGEATATGVRLSWGGPPQGAVPSFYVIEAGTAPGLTSLPAVPSLGQATTIELPLPAGVYYFRVRAGNSAGLSGPSNEIRIVVASETLVPGSPTGLTVNVDGGTATISWERPRTGGPIDLWWLDLSLDASGVAPASPVGRYQLPAGVTHASGDLPDGRYLVRVRGVNEGGEGPASNDVSFVIGGAPGCAADIPDPPVLLPPVTSGGVVTLAWRAPQNAAAQSYLLIGGSAPGAGDLGQVEIGAATSYTLAEPRTIPVYVTAFAQNACGISGPSNIVEIGYGAAGALPAPVGLRTRYDGTTAELAWEGVPGATAYLLEIGTAPGITDVLAQPTPTASAQVLHPPPGRYYVRVRALSPAGTGPASSEIVVVVP